MCTVMQMPSQLVHAGSRQPNLNMLVKFHVVEHAIVSSPFSYPRSLREAT